MPRFEFDQYIGLIEDAFSRGQSVTIPVSGSSMEPTLLQGEAVTLSSCCDFEPQKGDILLYRRKNGQYVLHRAVEIHDDTIDFCGDAQVSLELSVPRSSIIAYVSTYEKNNKIYNRQMIQKVGLRRLRTRKSRRVVARVLSYTKLSKAGNREAVSYILRYLKRHVISLVLMSVLSVVSAVCTLGMAMVSGRVIDKAMSNDMHNFRQWFFLLFGLLVFVIICNIVYSNLRVRAVGRMKMDIRKDLFELLFQKSYSDIQQIHSGEYMNRFTADIQIVVESAATMIPQFASLCTKLIGGLAIMLIVEPLFTSAMIVFGVVAMLCLQLASRYYKRIHKECQESEGKTRAFVQECTENLTVVKSFNSTKGLKRLLETLQQHNFEKLIKRNYLSNIGNTAVYAGFMFAYYSGLAWGVLRIAGVIGNTMTVGVFAMFLQIMEQIRSPFKSASGILPQFYSMCASAERLLELGRLPEETYALLPVSVENLYDNVSSIKIRHMDFSYDRNQPIFINASCEFRKGEMTAIVGDSGIGKSTLIKLLLGLLTPQSGDIVACMRTDTVPVSASSRPLFCYAPQGNMILSGTLLQNIVLGCENVTEDKVKEAICLSCLEDMVKTLPKGLYTHIGERGIGLSEGQIQRLAVARALVSDSPVLLLDESTSALDACTEKKLLENLLSLKDKTIIFISHKEAVIKKAHRVLEIRENAIIERC